VGGLLDMISQSPDEWKAGYKQRNPQATDAQAETDYQNSLSYHIDRHVKDAANWLRSGTEPQGFWEHVGAIGEQIGEFMGGEGLLKMVGTGAKVVEGARALETAENLKNAQQVAQTLTKNPKVAGLVAIGLKASKDAVGMAAQTYAHTEDPTQAGVAGAFGGVLSGAAGLAMNALARIVPRNIAIAGETMPALASQVGEHGQILDTGAEGAPAVARAQQAGAQNVIRNTAAQAAAGVLDRINQTNPIFNAIQEAGRMLPAPEGTAPFTFTLEGPGTTTTTEGEMAQSAAKVPGRAAFKEPQYTTASAPTREVIPGRAPDWAGTGTATEGQMGADIRSAGTPEPATDVARGGGTLQTTNPAEAESWLRQIEDLQSRPEYDHLPDAQQSAIEAQRKALREQLGIYHASPYAQRWAPIDIWDASSRVRTFGDAATQIQNAAQPVYGRLDNLSNGGFNTLREVAERSLKTMRNPASEEAYQTAAAKYDDAVSGINDLIDRNRGQVSEQDYFTAKNAWRASSRLDELHTVVEGMMNGVTTEQGDSGLPRVMTGSAKRLNNYLEKGTNREQIQQMIGKDGVDNLTKLSLLMSNAGTARAYQTAAGRVADALAQSNIRTRGLFGSAGAGLGGAVAQALGIHWGVGAAGGGAAAEGIRMVLKYAATNPRIGNMLEYAVRNGLSPQHFAPLIARAIAEPFQTQEQPEQAEPVQNQ
jgi:hypothetical protein